MSLRTKKSLKNQAYRDLYAVSGIVFTTAKVASLNVMIFIISLFCSPNNKKFRYSFHLHCSQVILQTNAVYWLYTTIIKHIFQEIIKSWLSIKITTKRKSTWINYIHICGLYKFCTTHRCDILSPLKKTYVSLEAVYFYKGWGFKHFTTTV